MGRDAPADVRGDIRRLMLERRGGGGHIIEYCDGRLADLHRRYPRESGLGSRLRDARRRSGLSQEMVARIAGVHPSTISRLERAQPASERTITAVCQVLRVAAGAEDAAPVDD